MEICQHAPCWLLCLLKIYIVLHEACKQDFHLPKLQEKHNKAMLTKLSALEGGSSAAERPAGTPARICKKSGGQVHPSGMNQCPFCNMSDADAKKHLGLLMTASGGKDDPRKAVRAAQKQKYGGVVIITACRGKTSVDWLCQEQRPVLCFPCVI